MKKLLLLFVAIFGVSCASISGVKKVDPPKMPEMKGETKKFKKGIDIDENFKPEVGTLKGNVWDMKGGTYELVGGKCNNDENGIKPVITKDNLTIKNGRFSHWEDGVNIRAKNVTFDNIIFINCEDSLNSGEGSESFTVKNCYFAPHPKKESSEKFKADKLCQFVVTRGSNRVENNVFYDAMCGIRVGLKKYSGSKYEGKTVIKNNKFVYISTAVHQVRGEAQISGNEYISVAEEFKKEGD